MARTPWTWMATVLLGASLWVPGVTFAQGNFEIQVYGSETVEPGTTMVELWTCSGNPGHMREEISSHHPAACKHKKSNADISKPAKRSCSALEVCCGVRRRKARCWTLIHWASSSSISSSCGDANIVW